jgi:spore coat polysaccharide biosynthesis predicted glycosyltransferase SpsG
MRRAPNAIVPTSQPHTLAAPASPDTLLVAILADGGARLGFGHIGRCLAIIEQLDGRAAFAVRDPDVARVLESRGIPLVAADAPARVLLVDRRDPTGAQEADRMRASGRRVCLLDDPGDGRMRADLIVDPPTARSWPPWGGRRLAGFEHALLRRELRAAAGHGLGGVEVLLSMGGSDPEGLTPVLARALRAVGISVLSVLGPTYQGPEPVGEVLTDPQDWPRALAGAHLLVGRFGHTLLEAAHLGTPALALSTSADSAIAAAAFAEHGTALTLHVARPSAAGEVAARALALLSDGERLEGMSRRGRELVDGRGPGRVAAALQELA